MSKFTTVVCVSFCVLQFACFLNAQSVYKSNLDSAQITGSGSPATGFAVLCLDETETTLSMEISFDGLDTDQLLAFHVHSGLPGENGPVEFGLINPDHTPNDLVIEPDGLACVWDPSDGGSTLPSQLTNLDTGRLYFVAHTQNFQGGEIRGQILPVLLGDVNEDGVVSLEDIPVFVGLVASQTYQIEGDMNKDGDVSALDTPLFIGALKAQ